MTPTECRAAVERIRAMRGDDEMAHGAEDDLHVKVLRWIATEADHDGLGPILAAIALETLDIEFARWCA